MPKRKHIETIQKSETLFAPASKQCARCKKEKPLIDFPKSLSGRFFRFWHCRECCSERAAISRKKRVANFVEVVPDLTREYRCPKCKATKPGSEFFRARDTHNGLKKWCKECESESSERAYDRRTNRTRSPLKSKKCLRCLQLKPAAQLTRDARMKDGYTNYCKACAKQMLGQRTNTPEAYLRYLMTQVMSRRNSRVVGESNLNLSYLVELWNGQDGRCIYTGEKLTHRTSTRYDPHHFTNASIDRIDSSKGYVQGNVQIISCWANMAKNCLSHEAFIEKLRLAANHLVLAKRKREGCETVQSKTDLIGHEVVSIASGDLLKSASG